MMAKLNVSEGSRSFLKVKCQICFHGICHTVFHKHTSLAFINVKIVTQVEQEYYLVLKGNKEINFKKICFRTQIELKKI